MSKYHVWSLLLCLIVPAGSVAAQDSAPERGHGLTEFDVKKGWISLFDGKTTFGWTGARVEDGRLVGGVRTSEFGGCEVRCVDLSGRIHIIDTSFTLPPGKMTFRFPDPRRRGPIELKEGATIRFLAVRPLGLKTLFDGRSLDGCTPVNPPKARPGVGPTWTLEKGMLHAKGGPGAMELPGSYANFVLQAEVRTRGRHSNGGIFFRNPPGTCMMGYEAQLYNSCEDDDPAKPTEYATGGIDDRQNARRLVSRDGKPFSMTVIAKGPHIATWVNGYQVTDWTDTRPKDETPRRGLRTEAGTIQLQAHDPDTDLDFGRITIAGQDVERVE